MSGSRATQPADGLEARDGAATRLPSDGGDAQGVLLDVRDLSVVYESAGQEAVQAVDHVSFQLRKGEFVGLVGESGSGKSTLGYALTRLQKPPARTNGGNIVFAGSDIRDLDEEALRQQRQGGFAMVLQSGMNALNPVRTVRNHFIDIFKAHGHVPRDRWDARMKELIEKVKLPTAMLARYPGELSGGMRQRVSIALALSLEPQVMVFDEPTTALDVLVQHAVMDTVIELQQSEGFTAVLISHDLGIVLEATERVLVMHEGRIVEDGGSKEILRDPQDEYTKMLLSHYADPRASVVSLPGFPDRSQRDPSATRQETTSSFSTVGSRERSAARNPIVVEHLVKTYPAPRRGEQPVQAVRDVSFTLEPGQSLALVGQSGSGKSTIAKMLTGVEKP
ncbi:MAG: ATP-binding cassette domain-containing protein, partial [Curtobacterium sp.]